MKLLYESLVVPTLTYASVVWSPHTDLDFNLLESVHHRFLRYLCYLNGHPMHYNDHNYKHIISKYRVPSIRNLHDYHDLLVVFKIVNNIISIESLRNLFTSRSLTYGIRQPRDLEEYIFKFDFLFQSSIPRIIRKWNLISNDIKLARSVSVFKNNLKCYIFKF